MTKPGGEPKEMNTVEESKERRGEKRVERQLPGALIILASPYTQRPLDYKLISWVWACFQLHDTASLPTP